MSKTPADEIARLDAEIKRLRETIAVLKGDAIRCYPVATSPSCNTGDGDG